MSPRLLVVCGLIRERVGPFLCVPWLLFMWREAHLGRRDKSSCKMGGRRIATVQSVAIIHGHPIKLLHVVDELKKFSNGFKFSRTIFVKNSGNYF